MKNHNNGGRSMFYTAIVSPIDVNYCDPRLDEDMSVLEVSVFKPLSFYDRGRKCAMLPNDKARHNKGRCTLEPNYDYHCESCGQSPTVGKSELCGACFFGEADCIDPDNW